MITRKFEDVRMGVLVLLWAVFFDAHAGPQADRCVSGFHPKTSFVEFQSLDLSSSPPRALPVKGKLNIPIGYSLRERCLVPRRNVPAVVILHGSAGVDSTGDFYARALNAVGIATLEVDMWEARGVTGISDRIPMPMLTYPDAFGALAYLSGHEAIDSRRIGVLGFSWGAVMALGAAEQLYVDQFGNGLRFAAHVANYPVCYGANDPTLFHPLTPHQAGTYIENLTGAPVLIQIGTADDYDNGADACKALGDRLNASSSVQVDVYQGATHAWDRLQVPRTVRDPFADRGSFLRTGIVPDVRIHPDVDQAHSSRRRVVRFFLDSL